MTIISYHKLKKTMTKFLYSINMPCSTWYLAFLSFLWRHWQHPWLTAIPNLTTLSKVRLLLRCGSFLRLGLLFTKSWAFLDLKSFLDLDPFLELYHFLDRPLLLCVNLDRFSNFYLYLDAHVCNFSAFAISLDLDIFSDFDKSLDLGHFSDLDISLDFSFFSDSDFFIDSELFLDSEHFSDLDLFLDWNLSLDMDLFLDSYLFLSVTSLFSSTVVSVEYGGVSFDLILQPVRFESLDTCKQVLDWRLWSKCPAFGVTLLSFSIDFTEISLFCCLICSIVIGTSNALPLFVIFRLHVPMELLYLLDFWNFNTISYVTEKSWNISSISSATSLPFSYSLEFIYHSDKESMASIAISKYSFIFTCLFHCPVSWYFIVH